MNNKLFARHGWMITLQAAVLAAGLLFPISHADTTIQEIKASENTASTVTVNPTAQAGTAGSNVAFHVINDTSHPVIFNVPKLGISYFVAPNYQPTFYLSVAPAMDPRIGYQLVDPSGAQLAYGDILNQSAQTSLAYIGQSSSTDDMLKTKYSSTSNENRTSTNFSQPTYTTPPAYTPKKASYHHHRMVRGYW